MLGHQLLHKLLRTSLPFIHVKRLATVMDAVQALLKGKKLSLSLLGRSLENKNKERHNIRKIDRLLGNTHLHQELDCFYQAISMLVLHKITQPIISIDWSCVNKRKDWHILRASVSIQGRALTLYQQVYPKGQENSPKAQREFLLRLKQILPKQLRPIIITDAGFRCPWFKQVQKLGFDWIGRIRHKTYIYQLTEQLGCYSYDLYRKASSKPLYLGQILLTKANPIRCHMMVYKKIKKGRVNINRSGLRTNNNASNRCARRETDPWLLATSLNIESLGAEKIQKMYSLRMQIEQDFRDTKSHQYGFGLRYSLSNHAMRLQVLLLIATLAALACWLIALAAERKNLHYDYQASSTKHRRILSVVYLACQIVRKNISFTKEELLSSFDELHKLILYTFTGDFL